jgi:2-amino-4-hydroxy-6-hydroxymethyldihydropteridine diphosphokinase
MQKKTDVYLLSGSNIEPRLSFLQKATELLENQVGIIKKKSSIYESEPWGFKADISFLNQVILITTVLSADELLNNILHIEHKLNRKREGSGYTSRTIDIDILYYGNSIVKDTTLTIPHASLHKRIFTLIPLAEIAGDFLHPVLKLSNRELLARSEDKGKVWRYEKE